MPYVYLRQRDQLPAVGVLQKLLNRAGATLNVDGQFGRLTRNAVIEFQRPRGLGTDGIVGEITWPRLAAGAPYLDIIDCIDVFDPDLLTSEARDIRRQGGTPILIGGMSNGVEQAVNDICRQAHGYNVFLLRFHGHGSPGAAGVSDGTGAFPGEHLSSIHTGNYLRLRPVIRRLQFIFGPYGCIQFMHCSTGRGLAGRQLLQTIANDLGVPVSAGTVTQYGGGIDTFRFEGPTFTAIPGGVTLRNWCRTLPDFPGMTPR